MINRELYMSRIRPFINQDIVKVLTGIRRSGKSVMLELIQDELRLQGIPDKQFLTVNFESRNNTFNNSLDDIYAYIKELFLLSKFTVRNCLSGMLCKRSSS